MKIASSFLLVILMMVVMGCSSVTYKGEDPGTYHYGHPGHEYH
jgi:hypothetical protein